MTNFDLTPEFQNAISMIENTNECLYITGKAGTGKTTLLKHILQTVQNKKIMVAASTGIAAINAGGVTLHSFFSIPFSIYAPNSTIHSSMTSKYSKIAKKIDVLIIDEISMVRPDTIDFIDARLRYARKSHLPFGGVQVVMFGDLYQLPPVILDKEKEILDVFYRGAYFFYAHALRHAGFRVLELTKIFRQTDQRFIEILNNIRTYNLTPADIEELAELRDKASAQSYERKTIHLCSYKKDVDRINTTMLGEPTHTYSAKIDGQFRIANAPCDELLKLRVGARIMMLTNHHQQLYSNGSLGEVVTLTDTAIAVKLDSGPTITVTPHTWEEHEYILEKKQIITQVKGTCTQFPVALAWAMTIHKSQGLTFDSVTIHAPSAFCAGQIYVALSRCKSMEGIVLDSFINERHIRPNKELSDFEKAYKANFNKFNSQAYQLMVEYMGSKR